MGEDMKDRVLKDMLESKNVAEKTLACAYISLHERLKHLGEETDIAGKEFLKAKEKDKSKAKKIYEEKKLKFFEGLNFVKLFDIELWKSGYGILASEDNENEN